jgi:acyl dehydratase
MTTETSLPATAGSRLLGGMFSQRFESLRVGDGYTSQGRTLTETDVVMFAHMTGDNLPVHTDAHWAERHGMHGRRTANGLLTLSYAVGLLPLDIEHVIALRRICEVVFKRPAFLGDTIRAQARIQRLIPLGSFGCVVTSVHVINQNDEVVLRGTFEMLWKLGESSPSAGTE